MTISGVICVVHSKFLFSGHQYQSSAFDGLADGLVHPCRDVELGEITESVDDLLPGHAGAGRIPQGERVDLVGVEVFRRPFELSKARDEVASQFIFLMSGLKENLSIALYDDRVVRPNEHRSRACCPRMGVDIGSSAPFSSR